MFIRDRNSGMVSKTNWFNVNQNKSGSITIGLSIQDNNQEMMGLKRDGGIDKNQRQKIINKAIAAIGKAGFSQTNANAKHGTIEIKDATYEDHNEIKYHLLNLEV